MPRTLLEEDQIEKPYQQQEHQIRRNVLRDTLGKLEQPGALEHYHDRVKKNHRSWANQAKIKPPQVRVLEGDWGDITLELSRSNGQTYAVLNMANAHVPGGGYLEGMVAQEENMYRRTDCHYFVKNEQLDPKTEYYTQDMTQLIHGENGKVYLDVEHPRICIKEKEVGGKGMGYEDLKPEDYFEFYELKSAADDLRGGKPYNEASMRKKIVAQLDTLIENKVRHVVLSAFGCGAFGNPAKEIAKLYKEELIKRAEHFDDVAFAIYYAGYGPKDNITIFKEALDGLHLGKKLGQEQVVSTKPQKQIPLNAPQDLSANAQDPSTLLQSSSPVTQDITRNQQEKNSTDSEIKNHLLKILTTQLNDKKWDQKGYGFLFLDCFKKTPDGIVKMRNFLQNPDNRMSDEDKLRQLQKMASDKVKTPLIFTKRDDEVLDFYKKIQQIAPDKIDEDMLKLFTAPQPKNFKM